MKLQDCAATVIAGKLTVIFSRAGTMLKERFVHNTLVAAPPKYLEEVASDILESNRVPDPYLYLVENHRLVTPTGSIIGEVVEKESYLGQIEYAAFQEIERWADKKSSGKAVWFSPPYPGVYPVSKIIISELSNHNGTKILFNRAIVLDIDGQDLMRSAGQLSNRYGIIFDNEQFRACPFFPTEKEFAQWFSLLGDYTSQTTMIEGNEDIDKKNLTLQRLAMETVAIAGEDRLLSDVLYGRLYDQASRGGMIGPHPVSCPSTKSFTSFEQMLNSSLKINETHTLDCVCPYCKQRVRASISNGEIHCPNCSQTAPYRC